MASLSTNKINGRRKVQFSVDGKRRTIHLGKIPKRQAESVKLHIEHLVSAHITGHAVGDRTSLWLSEIDERLAVDLAKHGLTTPRKQRKDPTLKQFVGDYIKEFSPTVKPNTIITWKQCERLLLEKFDGDTLLKDFTTGNAIQFRNHLLTRGNERIKDETRINLAETTVRKRCACAKQFFSHAVALDLIPKNPFISKKIPTNSFKADQKDLVSLETSYMILDKLPNAHWRLLFALARFGGLRIPSEPQHLMWSHVDWDNQQMLIHSPKTEHHKGHETRVVPIFGELMPYLQACWDLADEGEGMVLPMLRGKSNSYCRKPILRAMEAAGITTPWKKLFNTLRANRDTELREDFPGHVVDAWIGHDERVAKNNYLQITHEHYQKAIGRASDSRSDAKSDAASVRNVQHEVANKNGNPNETAGIAVSCGPVLEHANGPSGGDRN